MIDLHSHVLPGLDDGPADLDAAVALARAAEARGVQVLVATPHIRPDHPRVLPRELGLRAQGLQSALDAAGVGVRLVSGAELDLVSALEASDEDLRHASLGGQGTDLLVETPAGELTHVFDAMLFQLESRGYRIVLAHPERNPTFRRRPERVAQVVARGILLQVTAFALAGPARRSPGHRLACDLVRDGLAHVIASDAHAAEGPRAPILDEGVRAATRLAPGRAAWMASEAPAAILAGAPLPVPAPVSGPRRRPWRRRAAQTG